MRKPLTLCSDTLSSVSRKENENAEKMEKSHVREGVSPSELVIRNIMNYSKALSVLSLKDGFLYRVMN